MSRPRDLRAVYFEEGCQFSSQSGLNTSTRKSRIATPQTRIGTSPNQRGFSFCGAVWRVDDRLKRKSGKLSKLEEEVMRVVCGGGVLIFGVEKSVGRARREILLSDDEGSRRR